MCITGRILQFELRVWVLHVFVNIQSDGAIRSLWILQVTFKVNVLFLFQFHVSKGKVILPTCEYRCYPFPFYDLCHFVIICWNCNICLLYHPSLWVLEILLLGWFESAPTSQSHMFLCLFWADFLYVINRKCLYFLPADWIKSWKKLALLCWTALSEHNLTMFDFYNFKITITLLFGL